LFDAAEKAGAKVVVYEPQSPEIVDLVVNIFTKINRPGRKSARAHKGSAKSRPRFGPNESERSRRLKKLRAGKEKKKCRRIVCERWKPPPLQKRKFVGRWNLTNSIRSEITPFDRSPKFIERAGTEGRIRPTQVKTLGPIMFGNPERRRNRRPGENLIRQEDVFVHHAFRRRKVQSNHQMEYTKNDASMSSFFSIGSEEAIWITAKAAELVLSEKYFLEANRSFCSTRR
jgi:hypothetical protein